MLGRRGRWLKGLLLAVLLAGSLSGCWDRRDPEDIAWITAIGVDLAPGGGFLFTVQIPAVKAGQGGGASKEGGAGGGEAGTVVYSVAAPDLVAAIDGSQAFVARRVSLMHAKVLVIGEAVAREDVTPVLSSVLRYYEFRRAMAILVARGTARSFMELAKPKLENNSARWFELMSMAERETELLPMTRVHEFVVALERRGLGAIATLVAARPDVAAGTETLGEGEEEGGLARVGEQKAGEVRRLREIPVEFMGSVFKGRRMVGTLTGDETRLLTILRGELRESSKTFEDPVAPGKPVVIRLKQRSAPDAKAWWDGRRVHAHFHVKLEGTIQTVQNRQSYSDPADSARLERAASRELEQLGEDLPKRTLTEWGADAFKIGNRLIPRFATWSDWERFDWGSRVRETAYRVEVDFRLRRLGMQIEPLVPGE